MVVNGKPYNVWSIETFIYAAEQNPDRVTKLTEDIWTIDSDQGHKYLFCSSFEAWDRLVAELQWGAVERNYRNDYEEPELTDRDDLRHREDVYWDWWRTVIETWWDRVDPNDLEIACIDSNRPVWTVDGIVRNEDGDEQYHTTCWGTWGVQLRPEAKFWTYDNYVYQFEIVELAESGWIQYRVFDLLPED